MTTFDAEQPYMNDFEGQQPQKTSGMAIASLVCSLILCCPVTTILGILLGGVAIVRIGKHTHLKGRGLALAGIILGVLFTIGQLLIALQFYRAYETFRDAPAAALEPGFRGDYAGLRDYFGPSGQAVTDEEARVFIEELRSRYGELRGSDLDWEAFQTMQQPSPGQAEVTMPWLLVFDNATVEVEVTFNPDDQRDDEVIFRRLRVIDPDRGDLEFPPGSQPIGEAEPQAEEP